MATQVLERAATAGGEVERYQIALRNAITQIVSDIVVKNDRKLMEERYSLNIALDVLTESPLKDTDEVKALTVQVKEYIFIIDTYFQKNINVSFIEELEEQPYSMLILESLRRSKINESQLRVRILEEDAIEQEVEAYENTFEFLREEGLIQENEDEILELGEKAENLFKVYSSNKKVTNKFERVKRNQIESQPNAVNVGLLDSIEKIKNGFGVMDVMYNFASGEAAIDLIEDILAETMNSEEIGDSLVQLEDLHLLEQYNREETTLFAITNRGKKVFETYKKSKQYTNKYEKVRRTATLKA